MIIYKTTNLINGKIYIGQSTKNDLNYFGSGEIFKKALKKYTKKNFIKEIIENCYSQKQLDVREKYWITKLDSRNPKIGYNIDYGGRGRGKTSPETKQKISNAKKGKNLGKDNVFYNKHHTNKTKKHLSFLASKRTGNKNSNFNNRWNKIQREKMSKRIKLLGQWVGKKNKTSKSLKLFYKKKKAMENI